MGFRKGEILVDIIWRDRILTAVRGRGEVDFYVALQVIVAHEGAGAVGVQADVSFRGAQGCGRGGPLCSKLILRIFS